jgi:AcrR family transcriptional regulator
MNTVPTSGPDASPARPDAAGRTTRTTRPTRTGRRPGDVRTRDAILTAARASFAEQGYDRTTIRGVASRAGVDPALVHYFFGGKDQLFSAAMELGRNPAEIAAQVLAGDLDGMGERLVRTVLAAWDDPDAGPPLLALIRGAASHEQSATLLREYLGREVLGRIGATLPAPDRELRATLAGTQLVGLAMARYVVKVPAVATADPDTLVSWIGPILQRYLTGPAPH